MNPRQIRVGHQAVSLLWTARAAGESTGFLLLGTAFGSPWMDSSRKRLIFLGTANLIVAVCLFLMPFINQYILMITRKVITNYKVQ